MRIVIQHPVSRSYFNGSAWDDNEEEAAKFENVVEAEQFCRTQNLVNALIVLKFKDGNEEISYRACQSPSSASTLRPLTSSDVRR